MFYPNGCRFKKKLNPNQKIAIAKSKKAWYYKSRFECNTIIYFVVPKPFFMYDYSDSDPWSAESALFSFKIRSCLARRTAMFPAGRSMGCPDYFSNTFPFLLTQPLEKWYKYSCRADKPNTLRDMEGSPKCLISMSFTIRCPSPP